MRSARHAMFDSGHQRKWFGQSDLSALHPNSRHRKHDGTCRLGANIGSGCWTTPMPQRNPGATVMTSELLDLQDAASPTQVAG